MRPPHPVLVVGDANVDLVLRGDVVPRFGQQEQLLSQAEVVLGGSAAIVACGLARLGVPTTLAAVVGDDAFGTMTLHRLRECGVDTSSIRVDGSTPTGISVILSAEHDRSILTLPGTIPMLRDADLPDGPFGWVHVASPFLMPDFTAGSAARLARYRAAGAGISLDTNWDPSGSWQAVTAMIPDVDVLLPNRTELEALRGVADLSATRVVVKDGAAGGWSALGDQPPVRAAGLAIDVVDTTGAGDSFDAGYLAALAYGIDDEATRVRWAAVAGSLSTRAAGGTGAQADLAELQAAL